MASSTAPSARVGMFVKFLKTQWGDEWAKDKYGDGYEKLYDWVMLKAYVSGTAKKKAFYLFDFEGDTDCVITEDEVCEAAMAGDVVGTILHSRKVCFVFLHVLHTIFTDELPEQENPQKSKVKGTLGANKKRKLGGNN